jgi:putative FmdB family regulatory protein
MPTYQYRCTACGEDLEVVQKFSDAPLTVCPTCGGHLRKVFNAVGVVFKGSGFYRTDSRNGSKSDDGAESGSSEKKSPAEKKSAEKESAGAGSAASASPGNGRQSASSMTSSTGERATAS